MHANIFANLLAKLYQLIKFKFFKKSIRTNSKHWPSNRFQTIFSMMIEKHLYLKLKTNK